MDNALTMLLLLRSREKLRITECAEEVGVAPSTAHRLLAMLEFHGLIQREQDAHSFRAGPALLSLGLASVRRLDIRRRARPYMKRLASELRETISLIVLEDDHVRFLDAVESPHVLRISGRVGLSLPAHRTSAGKAMLATLSTERLRELYPDEELSHTTESSLTTRSELEAELDRVRAEGYALSEGESDPDTVAIGVAIGGGLDHVQAGLGIAAPTSRSNPELLKERAVAAVAVANELRDVLVDDSGLPS
ncbi:IclR family transcriptional regulator [Spiractinospora alimapuensis]|uniref:IclR family transcriptional regulator n=1 Tax=Spiractinospora alimapuensis TaxID=2820884 RepID=UPI001F45F907|nr:IclR family transcriptional regulator [Spiractinospora alimapuensis]QVQ53815.1 IclR family transcriptional regulator [Spiractinospora alimapuensis]